MFSDSNIAKGFTMSKHYMLSLMVLELFLERDCVVISPHVREHSE